ncbi:MAG: 2-succinyl-6-hydroxy-2,4-cyclohexadiene-1-carboxylate synthase [Spirulinaceae cyanobacterium]
MNMNSDYQFNYYFQGPCDATPVLFLHGFMGNSQVFQAAISLLKDQFFCLAVDLPGHGKTQVLGEDESYSMANTALGLKSLLSELNLKQAYVVGYSMGGRLALYLALNFPQYFPKVVLESASPGLQSSSARKERIKRDRQLAEELVEGDFAEFITRWYQNPLFNSLIRQPKFPQLRAMRLENNPLELAKSLQYLGTGTQPSLWSQLSKHNNPLLLLVGEGDHKFRNINQKMANLCPTAQLKIVPNCGHNIHLENLEFFVDSVAKFFANRSVEKWKQSDNNQVTEKCSPAPQLPSSPSFPRIQIKSL